VLGEVRYLLKSLVFGSVWSMFSVISSLIVYRRRKKKCPV
jgi:hypothetical protein